MNRYDVASVAKFSPLSFNELATAPTMMRQKHDASIAQAEAMRIKADPYSKHYNRALELKQQMDNEIAKNVDTLNKEGYNPTTFQNITKLNRQYNDMISPTGEIGQINAENINIKKINEEYDKLGKEKNWGQETVDYWKNKALKEYNEKPLYDANGRILSYSGPEGIVNKVDYNKRLHELASSAKMSVSEFSNAVTKLGMDEKSGYNVANKNSEAHKLGDNYARVKDAYDTLKKEIYDPTSEVHKSMRYEGRDPKSLLDILKTQSDIYRQNVKSDEYSKDINPFGSGPGSGDGSGTPGTGVIINNDSTLKSDALDYTNYSDALNARKRLMTSNSPKDRAELADLEELQRNADSKLKLNPKYVELNNKVNSELKQWENAANKFNLSDNEKRIVKDNPNLLPQLLFSKGMGSYKGDKNDPELRTIMDDSKLSKFNNLIKERQSYKDAAWKESSSLRHNYSYLPSTPKEESEWNLHNENVYNVLKGLSDISNVLDLTSVYTTNGAKKNITSDEVSNVQELLKNADSKSFKINNIKTYGDNKTPEITMTFNTNKEASQYDMDRGLFSSGRSDKYGGAEKPVTVTFKLKKFSNSFDTGSAAGYKNLSGAISNFWKDKGGINQITGNFQGAEVYNSMIENAYSNISDKELYARAQSDSDAREALLIRVAKHQAKKQ